MKLYKILNYTRKTAAHANFLQITQIKKSLLAERYFTMRFVYVCVYIVRGQFY